MLLEECGEGLWFAVDKLRAEFDGMSVGKDRVHATADAARCFEDDRGDPGIAQIVRCGQTGSTGTDDDDILCRHSISRFARRSRVSSAAAAQRPASCDVSHGRNGTWPTAQE